MQDRLAHTTGKRAWVGGGLRTGIDIQGEKNGVRGREQVVGRLKWGLPQNSKMQDSEEILSEARGVACFHGGQRE